MSAVGQEFLAARVVVPRAAFEVDVSLGASRGEIIALLGPNGSGKSTVLQAIAGLIAPQRVQITLAGRILAGRAGTNSVPPHRRRIGLMGQHPLLFPHLTALENVAFGPRSSGLRRDSARQRARDWLERLDLGQLAGRRPAQLSGGQAQRVALARALAAEPDLLLLDEPLAAADVRTAGEIRQLLREHLRAAGQTTIFVTHEVLDAAVLADRVLVMSQGRVVDAGRTSRMLTEPGTEFGAALAGLNLIIGTATADARLRTDDGIVVAGLAETSLRPGLPASAVFSPAAVAVSPRPPGGSPRNQWRGLVLTAEPAPSAVRLRIALTGSDIVLAADVTPAAVAALPLAAGADVHVEVKATQVRLYQR